MRKLIRNVNTWASLILIFSLLIGFRSTLVQAADKSQDTQEEFLAAYGELLEKYISSNVRKEGIFLNAVNYAGWTKDPLHEKAMHKMKMVQDPQQLPLVDKMAFWINVYNLLTIDLIIKKQEKDSIRNLDGIIRNVWKIYEWDLDGEEYTLHEIEHDILRPMNEPRIHYAINCASLSCPDLRASPYKAKGLFTQLEEQERKFINDPTKGVYIEFDKDSKLPSEISISKLFKWYKDDFGGKKGIKALIHKYKNIELQEKPDYIDYNWDINGDW